MNRNLPADLTTKERLYHIIFESDTREGKNFDVALLIAILLSVLTVMLESVSSIVREYGALIRSTEWFFTVIFTIEYFLRIYCARNRKGYILSFYGMVDLISIIPTYLSLIVVGTQYVLMIRILRLLRVFRVLKLYHFLGEAEILSRALRQSAAKITVFLGAVVTLIFIVGSMMYLIEGPENGFTSIPVSIYWAIVTLTTVGYGDIAPQTIAGQMLASIVMIMGYGIIAVPTGIVSVELSKADIKNKKSRVSLNASSKQFCKPQEIKWEKIQQKAK
ncbi:ion transporter [Catalinimonas niigatensis]|uniref:ion transporter n=1 Tax=Catalinimonas niigatensis TaxID=1397264 RepID=UPI0026654A5A|nr:ion transporter [Catalinimonas niigatensis]WPP50534.1 ion transporter [Catalinimonas niigatensis]